MYENIRVPPLGDKRNIEIYLSPAMPFLEGWEYEISENTGTQTHNGMQKSMNHSSR